MWRYFLKTAFRKTIKNRNYSLLNLLGLGFGIAVCILIFLYIRFELSYDSGWSESEKIYRISHTSVTSEKEEKYALCGFGVGPELYSNFPEVKNFTRILYGNQNKTVRVDEKVAEQENVYYVDTSFFDIFDYPLIYGERDGILNDPKSLVISEKVYNKFFTDNIDPTGYIMTINSTDYTINGVFAQPHSPTHLNIEIMGSMNILSDSLAREYYETWVWLRTYTYLLFRNPEDAQGFQEKISQWREERIDPWIEKYQHNTHIYYTLHQLKDIHTISGLPFSMSNGVNPDHLKILALVAFFILIVACVNYINLSTAFAIERAREVGINKVLGAHRMKLIRSFTLEAVFTAFMAFIIALVIAEIFIPVLNRLTGANVSLLRNTFNGNGSFIIFSILIILVTGLLSGIIPAVVLSRFAPADVLKGNSTAILSRHKGGGSLFRRSLIIFQFIISLTLIICTLIVWQQIDFIKSHDPGFNMNNILIMDARFEKDSHSRMRSLREELLQHSAITHVSASRDYPGYHTGSLLFYWKEDNEDKQQSMNMFVVDEHYAALMGLEIIEGDFFKGHESEQHTAVVINRAAARSIGWKDPTGKELRSYYAPQAKVTGMVNDFNYTSLRNPVEPLVLLYMPQATQKLSVRISGNNPQAVIQYIEETWNNFSDGLPFKYEMLGNRVKQQYKSEEDILSLLNLAAFLALLLCCLGLLGLSSYATRSRTKEIGIRKVLGAGNHEIILSLIRDFFSSILLAGVIAFPLSWFLMNLWLESYAYHIKPGAGIFILSLLAIALITFITVIWQALKAAGMNVAAALKFE